jgi:hypothetical protein
MREIAAGAGLKSAGVLAKRAQNTWFWTTRTVPGLLAKATHIGGSARLAQGHC